MKIYLSLFVLLLTACCAQMPAPAASTLIDSPNSPPTATKTTVPTSTPTEITPSTPTVLPFTNPEPDFYRRFQVSPDGEWIAWTAWVNIYKEQNNLPDMLVENLSEDQSWLVKFDLASQNSFCAARCFFKPVLWTEDGGNLFLKAYNPYDGPYFSTSQAVAILKLSLTDGEVNTILPPRQRDVYFAISPDAEWLVYSVHDYDMMNFTLLNINTQQRSSFSIDYQSRRYKNFYWSPFDHSFIFGAHLYTDEPSIFIVNLDNFSFEIIFKGDIFNIESVEWLSPEEIRFTLPNSAVIVNTQTGETTAIEEPPH